MLAKIICDLAWLALFLLSFYLPVAVFMKDFSISLMAVSFDFKYMGMGAHVRVPFNEFEEQYCGSQDANSPLCRNLTAFKYAGIIYAILGVLCFVCIVHSLLQALIPRAKWLSSKNVGYLAPVLYAVGVLAFFGINIAGTDRPQTSYSADDELTFGLGTAAMIAAEIFAIAGAVCLCYRNSRVSSLEVRLIDHSSQYTDNI